MRHFFEFFHFTATERKGFIVLCLGIALIQVSLFVHKHFRPQEEVSHHLYELQAERASYTKEEVFDDHSAPVFSGEKRVVSYFPFDPNTASLEEWRKLGLSDRKIQVILNYRNKGGKFYEKEDLKKIYSLSENDYRRLEPYIRIRHEEASERRTTGYNPSAPTAKKREALLVEINSADTSQLKRLKGIGTVLSARIVKFREALGGFFSVSQLKEVYGMPQETVDANAPFLTVDTILLRRIPVNEADEMRLSKHPYISRKQAQTIVNYRKQHGPFRSIEDLYEIKSFDPDFLRKIEPYLQF